MCDGRHDLSVAYVTIASLGRWRVRFKDFGAGKREAVRGWPELPEKAAQKSWIEGTQITRFSAEAVAACL
jgi:hypothetical protein